MAARKRTPKPAPVVVTTICSICGENWSMHQEVDGEVSTLECVRLLKAKLAARPYFTYPSYYSTPWQWSTTHTILCGDTSYVGNLSTTQYVQNTNSATPAVAIASAA